MTTEAPITATIKLGPGFEAPWLVLRADTPEQALSQLKWLSPAAAEAANNGDYGLALAIASKHVQAKNGIGQMANTGETNQPAVAAPPPVVHPPIDDPWAVTPPAAQQFAPAQPPATQTYGAAAAPASNAPSCQHGVKVQRTGVGKNGKPWSAWMCPAPRGTADQCEPDWQR